MRRIVVLILIFCCLIEVNAHIPLYFQRQANPLTNTQVHDTTMFVLREHCDTSAVNFCSVYHTPRINGFIAVNSEKVDISEEYLKGFYLPPVGYAVDSLYKYEISIDSLSAVKKWFKSGLNNSTKLAARMCQKRAASKNGYRISEFCYSYERIRVQYVFVGIHTILVPDRSKKIFSEKSIPIFCVINVKMLDLPGGSKLPELVW